MIVPKVPRMTPAESKRGYTRVAERSFGLCEICGTTEAIQIHHRLHRSHGGDERTENLLHVCLADHYRAHHDTNRYVHGWAVRTGYDPGAVLVLYRGKLCWLLADGGLTSMERGRNGVIELGPS